MYIFILKISSQNFIKELKKNWKMFGFAAMLDNAIMTLPSYKIIKKFT